MAMQQKNICCERHQKISKSDLSIAVKPWQMVTVMTWVFTSVQDMSHKANEGHGRKSSKTNKANNVKEELNGSVCNLDDYNSPRSESWMVTRNDEGFNFKKGTESVVDDEHYIWGDASVDN